MRDYPPGRDSDPPLFIRLAADPTRWRLLTELAYSDRRVAELTKLLDRPQNDVSYHLGRLRAGGLVSTHRSTHDGRASYYRLELTRCGELITTAALALHPALTSTSTARVGAGSQGPVGSKPVRVLFVCTGNSGRSPMAEALLRQLVGARVDVNSAGTSPRPVHPEAVKAMREYGIDLRGRRSRSVAEFEDQALDFVITLCDRAREVCPDFPGHPVAIHWSLPNPADANARDIRAAFRATASYVRSRIGYFATSILTEAA